MPCVYEFALSVKMGKVAILDLDTLKLSSTIVISNWPGSLFPFAFFIISFAPPLL